MWSFTGQTLSDLAYLMDHPVMDMFNMNVDFFNDGLTENNVFP